MLPLYARSFWQAIARTLQLDGTQPPQPPLILFPLRDRSRRIVNEAALLASALPARLQRAVGASLHFVRLERMPVEQQLHHVAAARLIVGNHGQALQWAAYLRTELHRCAVIELYANASSDGLPPDCAHWTAINGVRYVPLPQQTAPACRGRLIRPCGHIEVDVEMLFRTIVRTFRAVERGIGGQ